jgi:CubicO group peptidase (beta-lactamase class C family)
MARAWPMRRARQTERSGLRPKSLRLPLAALLLIAFIAGFPSAARAQGGGGDAQVASQDTQFSDPQRGYEVTVPAGWSRRQQGEALALSGPDGQLRAWLVSLPADDAAAGVAAAWRVVIPDFAFEVASETNPPVSGGIEQAVQLVYQTDRDRVAFAIGYLFQGRVYAVMMNGTRDAFVRRQAQVSVVASSFDILARTRTDLASQSARVLGRAAVDDLNAFIPGAMSEADVPGAAVAVVQDGRVVYERAFGVKASGHAEPMTLDTQLMISSTTKSLTTLMMATLVDDGLMGWDTPVVDILPSFRVADPELSRSITMQNLVCACSGVPRRDYEFILNARTLSAEDVVRSLAGFQFFTGIGETFQYSNQMVASAGYIAGVAAGGDPDALLPGYAAALQARVLSPMGMLDTTLSMRQVEARGNHATPHGQTLRGTRTPIPLSEEELLAPVAPAGTAWSTAPDMARYLLTLLAGGVAPNGRRIVSAAGLEHLWTPQVKISADTSYGLGWMITDYKGLHKIEHAGNTFGFTSGLALLPDKGLGAVVLTNARASNIFNEAVIRHVIDLAFGQDTSVGESDFRYALKVTADALAKAAEHESGDIDPSAVQDHLGPYRNGALGELALSFDDGRFLADFGEFRTTLWRYRADDRTVSYLAADPPLAGLELELTHDANGAPTITMGSPPDRYVFDPIMPPRW